MDRRSAIVLGVAVVLGLIAVYLANAWFNGVQKRQEQVAEQQQLVRLAVASQDMPFGTPLTNSNVSLVNWPAKSVPPGSITDINRLMSGHNVSIRPIARGEPILLSRISDRAILSKNLPENMRAVTVPVNAVTGVSGFVFPGDVVDVLLTRQAPGNGATPDDKMTSVLLENVQVLAVDQQSSENDTNPKVSKTATLEVNQFGAQKLTLAQQVGQLSLALRNVKNQTVGGTKVATTRDLGGNGVYIAQRKPAPRPAAAGYVPRSPGSADSPARQQWNGPSMLIYRGTVATRQEVLPHARY